MNSYVEIPRAVFVDFLKIMGFEQEPVGGEVVYSRRHAKHPGMLVKVYTSIAEQGDTARAKGADAIRIVALLTWTRKGETNLRRKVLFQARILRVNSVEKVLERVRDKAREAYAACNEFLKNSATRAS